MIKKGITLLVVLCFLSGVMFAQSVPTFNKIYNVIGSLASTSTSIMPCYNGYVLYGETKDSNNASRVSIMKIDTVGNLIWSKSYGKKDSNYWSIFTYGGGGASVPSGGYIGVGYVGNDTGTWGTWDNLALFRFDKNGDTVWTKTYNDTARLEGWFVKVARNNRYILGSNWFIQKKTYFYTPALTLTDSVGNRIWQKTYHGAPNHVRYTKGIDTCKDGGYVLCTADYDTNYPAEIAENIVIIKTDSAGNPQWTRFIPPPYYNVEGENILSLKDGGYIVCGTQGTKNNWPNNYPLLYMTKLNDNGGTVWSNTYGNPAPPDFGYAYLFMTRELSNGDIIACGFEEDWLNATIKGCILKVDSNGNQKWLRYYNNGPASDQNYLWDIRPSADGGYVSCGTWFGSTESTWIVKTDSLGCDTIGCNFTAIEQVKENDVGVKVFPNPSTGQFTLSLSNVLEKCHVEVYNVLGEIVETQCVASLQRLSIDLTGQPNGIYLYRVITENGGLVGEGKIIVQR